MASSSEETPRSRPPVRLRHRPSLNHPLRRIPALESRCNYDWDEGVLRDLGELVAVIDGSRWRLCFSVSGLWNSVASGGCQANCRDILGPAGNDSGSSRPRDVRKRSVSGKCPDRHRFGYTCGIIATSVDVVEIGW